MDRKDYQSPQGETARILVEFLEVAITSIVFLKGVYPSGAFERRRYMNLVVQRARHPQLRDYIHSAVFGLLPFIQKGMVERAAVIFFNTDGIPVERFVFKLAVNLSYGSKVEEADLEFSLRSFLIKLSVSESLTKVLPHGNNSVYASGNGVRLLLFVGKRAISKEKKIKKDEDNNKIIELARKCNCFVGCLSILCHCFHKLHPIKDFIRLKRRKVEEKEFENKEELQPLMKGECTHPGTIKQMCNHCGKILQAESGVAISYIHEGIRLQNHEIVRHRNADTKNPLRHKKLYLVLDLDHTLLNSTGLRAMTSQEEHLKSQTDSLQDVSKGSLFMVNSVHMMTKLRPFVRTFLKEVSEMFELYIDTMGDRAYALEMVELLDPQREYFSGRVISRDDRTQKNKKDLDIFLGHESAVLILDDTEEVWQRNKENLIVMERYFFFASSCCQFRFNCKSLAELKRDESETDGALATVLKVLKKIHNMFFDELKDNLVDRDVRQMLKTVKKEVLKGCKIVFSRAFPTIDRAENQHLWKMAEQLGATCVTKLDSSVTHVVSTDVGTKKAQWSVKHKKFLVLPRWILAANYRWQKQPEQNFSVNKVS